MCGSMIAYRFPLMSSLGYWQLVEKEGVPDNYLQWLWSSSFLNIGDLLETDSDQKISLQ